MKSRLCLAVVLSVLLSLIVLPVVAADGDILMWVSRARLAYVGRSSTGTDAMVAYIHVRDATRKWVDGATVSAEWTLPNGNCVSQTATTNLQGIAKLSIWQGKGIYRLTVVDVTKVGWEYIPVVTATAPLTAR
jgi:hypothetical protein